MSFILAQRTPFSIFCRAGLLLLLVSCFSRVWLCATLWTAAHQDPPSWDSPGKNTGVGCHFLLHGFCYQQDSNPKLLILALFFPECTQQSRCVNHAWCLIHLVLLSFIYHLLNTTLWQALLGTVNDSCCPLSSSQETTTSCFYFFLFATNFQAKPTSWN